ncbi:MAG: phage integrase SAM-like domain-containing protein [Alistipes sp.]|nr:phage integrase SAM-like domain-containing protein [Alistipes sp.]
MYDFFRTRIEEVRNERSAGSLKQAYSAFVRFLGGRTIGFADFTEELLLEWGAWLLAGSYTRKTSAYYIKHLSALYGKAIEEGLAEECGGFGRVRRRILDLPDIMFVNEVDPKLDDKLRRLVRNRCCLRGEHRLAADLVLFAVLNGGLAFDCLANFRKDGYAGGNPLLADIVASYSRPRCKYLFPLKQSQRSGRQLRSRIRSLFADALESVGILMPNISDDVALDMWCMTALKCDFAPSSILGCAGRRPVLNPVFALVAPAAAPGRTCGRMREAVCRVLTENPEQWFAMQLRPHVGYDRLQARMRHLGIVVPEIYYPCEEIAGKIGRKLVYEKRPVIPGLLFFRSRISEVAPLFRSIGDLAWCYREGADRLYAVIPEKQMEEYRAAIDGFTSDMEIRPAGTFVLEEGDRVEVIGGNFAGKVGTFGRQVVSQKGMVPQRVVYRLMLPDRNGIEWVVDASPALVKKISEERYQSVLEDSIG